jgi:Fe-S-cluster containining protein
VNCSGACCAVFPLSLTYDRLRDRWPWITDGDFILDMLVPLDLVAAAERSIEFDGQLTLTPGREYFTCRHWDPDTRLCTVYDQRPDMCRRYPYRNGCDHGCSVVGKRTEFAA